MSKMMMTYDGNGSEVGMMTVERAEEFFGSVKVEADTGTISVDRPLVSIADVWVDKTEWVTVEADVSYGIRSIRVSLPVEPAHTAAGVSGWQLAGQGVEEWMDADLERAMGRALAVETAQEIVARAR